MRVSAYFNPVSRNDYSFVHPPQKLEYLPLQNSEERGGFPVLEIQRNIARPVLTNQPNVVHPLI